jgi:hypothetical protein
VNPYSTEPAISAEIAADCSRRLGASIDRLEPIGGGRNSRVYKLTIAGQARFVAKLYFRNNIDKRDRLMVEFTSLRFLRDHGISSVPEPIAISPQLGYGIYEYIPGIPIGSKCSFRFVKAAVSFATELRGLTYAADHLGFASEACFSLRSALENIKYRLNRLQNLEKSDHDISLQDYLNSDFIPAFREVSRWCESESIRVGINIDGEIAPQERTLSPSDFGCHNALLRSDGQIAFLDFEYFGWDDPAKLVSDFLLHPAMDLGPRLKRQFVTKILEEFQPNLQLRRRISLLYPLLGLKWCMILLNEFIPNDLSRRNFAALSTHNNLVDVRTKQLCKAARMLEQIRGHHGTFPYC